MTWPMVKLHDICRPKQWKTISASNLLDSGYPVYGANGKIGYYSEYTHESPTLMITCRGATCGNVHISEPQSYINGNAMALDRLNTEIVDTKYLFYFFLKRGFGDVISGSAQPQITGQGLTKVEIPLPPLAEQKRIAAILDKADAIRRKRQQTIQLADDFLRSYLDSLFCKPLALKGSEDNDDSKFGKWVRLSDVARLESGHTPSRRKAEYWGGEIKWLSLKDIKNINSAYIFDTKDKPSLLGIENSSARLLPKGTVALCRTASVGKCVILGKEMATSQDFVNWVCGDLVLPEFLYATLSISQRFFDGLKQGSTHKTIYVPTVKDFHIFLPPISTQQKVARVLKSVMNFKKQALASVQDFNLMFASTSQKAFSGQL